MSTRKITEGALLSAIVGVVLFLDRQTAGMLNYALYWIVPTPIIIYIAKYSVKDAFMPMFTITVLALVLSFPTTVYYVIMANIVALWYGIGIKKGKENHALLMISCLVSIASAFLTMFVFASLFGYNNDIALIQQTLDEMATLVAIDPNLLSKMVPAIAVSGIVMSGVLEGILVHLISYLVLTRLKFKVKPMKPLNQIRLSSRYGLMALIIWILCMYGMMTNQNQTIINMCVFGFYVVGFVFLINGYLSILTILAYYNKRKLSILLILVFPFLTIPGILDSLFDLRFRLTNKQ